MEGSRVIRGLNEYDPTRHDSTRPHIVVRNHYHSISRSVTCRMIRTTRAKSILHLSEVIRRGDFILFFYGMTRKYTINWYNGNSTLFFHIHVYLKISLTDDTSIFFQFVVLHDPQIENELKSLSLQERNRRITKSYLKERRYKKNDWTILRLKSHDRPRRRNEISQESNSLDMQSFS